MQSTHIPVLLEEAVAALNLHPRDNAIDCTVGGGGHAEAILRATAPDGKLLALDMDSIALDASRQRLGHYQPRVTFIQDNFKNLKQIYNERFPVHKISGILFDLGLSTLELEDQFRGFSFSIDAPLDMRFDARTALTAADIVNTWPAHKLQKVIREYGDEPLANEITRTIIRARQQRPLTKTKDLVEAVLPAFRKILKSTKEVPWIGGIHPVTKTFQALRIAVNEELENVESALPQAIEIIKAGGRIAVITFHSLEDRIVKQFFRRESRDCICPPEQPTCTCGHRATVRLISKKAIKPTREELNRNPRSRSAQLRVAEKI